MKVRHVHNRGLAEVDDVLGRKLIESGQWEDAEPKPEKVERRTRRSYLQSEDTSDE